MTREEQIRKNANAYTLNVFGELDDFLDVTDGFMAGAKWADENPKNDVYRDTNGDIISLEELEKRYNQGIEHRKQKLINKVCEWLENTLYIHTEYIEDKHWGVVDTMDWVTSDYASVEDFIENFRKVMEE